MTAPRTIDELLHHWPSVVRAATNPWVQGFAKSVAKQAKRRGWRPTVKQEGMMQRMVSELFAQGGEDDEVSLIESDH